MLMPGPAITGWSLRVGLIRVECDSTEQTLCGVECKTLLPPVHRGHYRTEVI
jgi:hypothetical protein